MDAQETVEAPPRLDALFALVLGIGMMVATFAPVYLDPVLQRIAVGASGKWIVGSAVLLWMYTPVGWIASWFIVRSAAEAFAEPPVVRRQKWLAAAWFAGAWAIGFVALATATGPWIT